MKKKILPNSSTIHSLVKNTGRSETLPFPQKPATNHFADPSEKSRENLSGSELFSLFTADIIKEDVRFTR